jgi:DNA polymerase III subunit epsilon
MFRLIPCSAFWRFVLVCVLYFAGVVVGLSLLFWRDLSLDERGLLQELIRPNAGYGLAGGLLLLAGAGLAVEWVFRRYVFPIGRIAEETGIMHGVHPGRRIRIEGSPEILGLAAAVNASADAYEALQHSVEERIAEAGSRLEEEKNILSVILAELPQGVLVCDPEGRIILYNHRARHLLESTGEPPLGGRPDDTDGLVGLNRSIFNVIDKPIVTCALDEIGAADRRGGPSLCSSVVIAGRSGRLLQVMTVPIMGPLRKMSGFVLILTDATEQMEESRRAESLLQAYMIDMRRALARIRTAVELIRGNPDLAPAAADRFHCIIHEGAIGAGEATQRTASEYTAIRPPGPLVRTPAHDLMDAVRRRIGDRPDLRMHLESTEEPLWIRADGTAMVLALVSLIERLHAEFGIADVRGRVGGNAGFVQMDFVWAGPPLDPATLRRWALQPVTVAGQGLRSTLKEILARHRAELWSRPLAGSGDACLRLLVASVEPADLIPLRRHTLLPAARPVYYDFDLFRQPGRSFELDTPLGGAAFTVFDTETTGLNPSAGDEIIAIGAVRIVNGRLLESERFDRLVKPGSALSLESICIHGIRPEMLDGQPDARQVLPLFQRFAEGTILVAHNAAFDMRLLQLQGERGGVRFDNPVLDTMLLSAVVHPAHLRHSLEAVAERLGVTIVDRHTALGDATAAAEIFLKLLPLLAAAGILTFKQAMEASRNTYDARLTY